MKTVAVVGAGIAGLTCGRLLQSAGHRVVWFEKSRGVGGRIATRRLEAGSWVDHGLRYWPSPGAGLKDLTQELLTQDVLYPWGAQGFLWDGTFQVKSVEAYCADQGINAIAKYLIPGCDIRRQHRLISLIHSGHCWQLTLATADGQLQCSADVVVLAMPAPQILPLLQPLDAQAAAAVETVDYAACLSLMANYGTLPMAEPLDHQRGWHITTDSSVLSWLALDSSKPTQQPGPHALLFQSQPEFATEYFAQVDVADELAVKKLSMAAVDQMLEAGAAMIPGLTRPQNHRLHRWRYSVVRQSYRQAYLTTQWPSLVGCGDWCSVGSETNLEAAYRSGLSAAHGLLQNVS